MGRLGQSWDDRIRWIVVQNDYTDTIPAYGAVKVASVDSQGLYHVTRPDTDNQDVMFNSPFDIPQGGTGTCTRDFPGWVLYNQSDGTPNAGDQWGAKAGDFALHKANTGFIIDGAATTSQAPFIVLAKHIFGGASLMDEYDDQTNVFANVGFQFFSKLDFILSAFLTGVKIQTLGMTRSAGFPVTIGPFVQSVG